MRVRRQEYKELLATLAQSNKYALDTETTGLSAYNGDRLFSIIISDGITNYYFNFQEYPGLDAEWVIPRRWLSEMQAVFDNPNSTWFIHNAKFDLSMLAADNLFIRGHVHDTEVAARLIFNNYLAYSLEDCAKRIGLTKSSEVDEYIKKHKLFTDVMIDGKEFRRKHYDRVPYDIMARYGEIDGDITWKLGVSQLEAIDLITSQTPTNIYSLRNVYENESKLSFTCFEMERVGIKINRDYCLRAIEHEEVLVEEAKSQFRELVGLEFKDSNKVFKEAFDKLGEKYPLTAKKNPSFNDAALDLCNGPVADIIRQYRASSKRAGTYYRNFLALSDKEGQLHANIRQAGTATGRFSYGEPNLQNLPKNEGKELEQEFVVRRAFIPRDEFCFVMIDYEQMEYRMMLNYAREEKIIEQVLAGVDLHKATGEMFGVDRKTAKTLNFMLLYGGGVAKLAASLGISFEAAEILRYKYFSALPGVQNFIWRVKEQVRKTGKLTNWFGFVYNIDKFGIHAAPNYLIQGGCAQVVRLAMNRIANFLRDKKSRMLVQVHDEIVFEVHKTELDIVPTLQEIMENAFKPMSGTVRLPLACSPSYSWVSWADKIEGLPKL